ncbi:undecaprenyl-phosphate glucose phosphotransferase [Anthocerotibacter panamensis]|uniref:undecaprenyl-phosphate glucose phosphotransferase n=1 Tax=Anthocerotibacter panamensis TaxID=2857077 RepID=UPI001C40766A|nr:undecaprenyl-phosphate glucose phosphotransferase [Anthocerotibacter panamensis]
MPNSRRLLRSQSPLLLWLQRLLDPLLVVALLFGLQFALEGYFRETYILLGVLVFFLVLTVFKAAGLYRSYRGEDLLAELPRLLGGWLVVLATLLFLGFVTKTTGLFSREVLLYWLVLAPALLVGMHLALRALLRHLRSKGFNSRTAVIVGATPLGEQLAQHFTQVPTLGLRFLGFFDEATGPEVLGPLHQLAPYVQQQGVDIVYMALPRDRAEAMLPLMEELRDTTASVYVVPDLLTFNLVQFTVQDLQGIPVYAICETPFADETCRVIKRLSDIVLASMILVAIAPLMLLIALGVKLSSPGPVFFRQRRYGLNGQEILVYKFRSMTVAEDGAKIVQAKQNDQRVTPFGALLRRTSLDELPQFINVLQGSMSIVGPRPHAVAHNEQYRKLIRGYMLRHKVKPGITGWAQVNGYRGETDTLEKMQSRVEYDLHYVNTWSLSLDLKIILRTFTTVLQGKNAY